jgi:hypothetical protein
VKAHSTLTNRRLVQKLKNNTAALPFNLLVGIVSSATATSATLSSINGNVVTVAGVPYLGTQPAANAKVQIISVNGSLLILGVRSQ